MPSFTPLWKVVNIADTGTSIKFGADDTDKINKLLNGIDVDDVVINSDWEFLDGKLYLRNPADTFYTQLKSGAVSANRVINLPAVTGTDTLASLNLAQTLSNKTLDSSCTISSGDSLPSDAVREGAANDFGDFDNSFKDNSIRIWNPDDTFRYTLIGQAITGDRDLQLPLITGTDTIDTLGLASTFTATKTFNSSTLNLRNPADTFSYTVVPSAIAADRNLTVPLLTGDDTLVTEAHEQSLTNKTADIIDNALALRGWNAIIFKSGSTYYARKADGSMISSGAVPETVIQAALDLGGQIWIANGVFTMSGSFAGLELTVGRTSVWCAGTTEFEVPNAFAGVCLLIDGSIDHCTWHGGRFKEAGTEARDWDAIKITAGASEGSVHHGFYDMVLEDCDRAIFLETTNASGFVNGNIFKNIWIDNSKIGVEFSNTSGAGMEGNTFNHVQVQSATSVTTNGFKNINGNNNSFQNCFVYDIDATATEVNITSTAGNTNIVGGEMTGGRGHFIDADNSSLILTRSFRGSPAQNVLMRPDVCKYGSWQAQIISAGDGLLNGRVGQIVVGTGSNSGTTDSTGRYQTFDTGATINSLSGVQETGATLMNRINNAYFKTAIYLNSVTNVRVFAGLISVATVPTSAADPLANLSGCALWLDSAVSANWKIGHNDGDATGDYDDTTVAAATSTLYPIEIYANNDDKFRVVFNGTSTAVSTEIPASTTNLGFWIYMENTTGASRTFRCYYAIIRSDK